MLFPIIRVNDNGYEHIVGTNSHDYLYIEDNAIHFMDIRSCEGTRYRDSGITFVEDKSIDPEYDLRPCLSVQFMDLEEIIDLATEHLTETAEAKIKAYRVLKEFFEKKIEDVSKETNINIFPSGTML